MNYLEETTPPPLAVPGLSHTTAGGWSILSVPRSRALSTRAGRIGSPGLWKLAPDRKTLQFAIPVALLDHPALSEWDDPDEPPLPGSQWEDWEAWAHATLPGQVPDGWSPPSAPAIEAWLPRNRRDLRHGHVVREVEVIRTPERLALRLRLAPLPPALPQLRRRWVRWFLTRAQSQWKLVRFGVGPDQRSLVAECDFTGAPPAVLPLLLQTGFDSLRWIVAGLAETAEFLASSETESRALEQPPAR